jgi:D-alanyl-D-alanine carboxypeptidase (penicillin-binding protein 5/6)
MLLFIMLFGVAIPAATPAYNKTYGYKSAIVMDAATGKILYEEDAHASAIPASLVKMMVLYLTMERLEAGQIYLTDVVTVSDWASHIGGQQVHLFKGETFTLQALLDAMVIASANDAAVAVAEFLAGDVQTCVAWMNARVKALGMQETTFANVHGLPPGKGQVDNVSTAYDMALLGRALLQAYPQVLAWTSTISTTFRNEAMTLVNTNHYLLRKVPGVDGLKTGFHARAGFNACVTAKRGERRLIVAIMDAPTKTNRDRAVRSLLEKGFAQVETPRQVIK